MGFLTFTLMICLCASHDFVSCQNQTVTDTVLVEMGDSITLNCTYNCSSGFVRGCWSSEGGTGCLPPVLNQETLCTVSNPVQNVSSKDLKKYICEIEHHDAVPIQTKTERVVLLKLKDQTSHAVTHKMENTKVTLQPESNTSSAIDTKDKPEMKEGIRVLAVVVVMVALSLAALAVYLCLTLRRSFNAHQPPVIMSNSSKASNTTLPLNNEQTSKQSERVMLRLPSAESEGDPEVPYADIIISVRGASTPDVSQALYCNAADRHEWWGGHPRAHLQGARSADMLHVPQPRDVSRKMSTSSDYAVITYS